MTSWCFSIYVIPAVQVFFKYLELTDKKNTATMFCTSQKRTRCYSKKENFAYQITANKG